MRVTTQVEIITAHWMFTGIICYTSAIKCHICADCDNQLGSVIDCGEGKSEFCLKAITKSGESKWMQK